MNEVGHEVGGKSFANHSCRAPVLLVLSGIEILRHDLVSNPHLANNLFNRGLVCALNISVRRNSLLQISRNCNGALIHHHDEVLTSIEQEWIIVDVDRTQIWTDPVRIAELFLEELGCLDLFGIDVAATSSWQKCELEVIFVTLCCVEAYARNFPRRDILVP